ncbi:MAG: universal stress protein [Coriobacteriia bacterium]|nr:universal stress protein [Coriobacteriia bacterium]
MIRSALIPADFTPHFDFIARFGVGLPALGVRRIVLGHVVDASGMEGPVIAAEVDRAREAVREASAPLAAAGLDVEVRIATGSEPSEELLGLAVDANVDAIVCGSHGKGTMERLIAGSVSEEVIVNAGVPSLMVRFGLLETVEDPADLVRAFGRTLVLTTDFSAASTRALMTILDLPRGSVSMLYIVHALNSALDGDKLRKAEDGAEFQLRNMADMAAQKGISARPVVRQGDPGRVALREIDERRATGVVAGTRGRGPLTEALLGSVSLTLVRQASCPVLIVH